MSNVVPLHRQPSIAERLSVRRIYRQRAKEVAAATVARALNDSLLGQTVDLNDALPIFVAAMRRELKKSGML